MKRRAGRLIRWTAALAAIVLLGGFLLFSLTIAPAVLDIAGATLSYLAVRAMNNSIRDVQNEMRVQSLISVLSDETGGVAMVQADTLAMSDMATRTALLSQHRLNALASQGVELPVGTVMGGPVFSGKGPPLYVEALCVGTVGADFTSEIRSAGINQTLLTIYLRLTASMRVMVGGASRLIEVTTEIPVSETLIVGNVPDTYLQSTRDEILNLVN